MLTLVVACALCLGIGFGVGRIKNSSKLAAINAELVTVQNDIAIDGKLLYAKIKAHL
jgi:hypothetical protein